MADTAAHQGVGFVVLTYPSSNNFYPAPSKEIRAFAEQNDVYLIDLQRYFQSLCHGDVECYEYFLLDAHPNARGYEAAAAYIADQFAAILERQNTGASR
jgi:hypothetical protein